MYKISSISNLSFKLLILIPHKIGVNTRSEIRVYKFFAPFLIFDSKNSLDYK